MAVLEQLTANEIKKLQSEYEKNNKFFKKMRIGEVEELISKKNYGEISKEVKEAIVEAHAIKIGEEHEWRLKYNRISSREKEELEKWYKEKAEKKGDGVVNFFSGELWSLLRIKYYKLYYSDYYRQRINIVERYLENYNVDWKKIDKTFKETTGYYEY